MTTFVSFFSRQLDHTLQSRRRLGLIMLLLVCIAAVGVVLLFQRTPTSIKYNKRYITATPAAVCPGESFTYPVSLVVEHSDAVSRVTEGWCRVSDGICPSNETHSNGTIGVVCYQVAVTVKDCQVTP